VAASPRTTRSIGAIIVGYRHRRSFGDIAGLAESIEREGLTAGSSRASDGLKACKRLGWPRVPVVVVAPDDIIRGELAENVHCPRCKCEEACRLRIKAGFGITGRPWAKRN
jgi:hypothetical protein